MSNEGKQPGRVEGSRRTRNSRAPLAFELYCCVCPFSPRSPLPLAASLPSASLPRAGVGRPAVPRGQRGRGSRLGALTLLWTPGTALSPAFGGEHRSAKLESYTAITYKTFIKSHIIFSSEGLALFFFSLFLLVGSLSFKIDGEKKKEKRSLRARLFGLC